jgi:cyclopropane-fatty-acyl-phospholipid synthase
MQNINKGQLRVLTYSHIYSFPAPGAPEDPQEYKAELRVSNDAFWLRLCLMSDLGFAEAYMYGDVDCDDLVSLFNVMSAQRYLCCVTADPASQIFLDNRQRLSNLNSRASYLFTLPQKLTSYRFLNTIGNSRSNISGRDR